MEDMITISKSELKEIIAKEIAKNIVKPSERLFFDVQIIRSGIQNANSKHQELVEFDKNNNYYGIGAYQKQLLVLFKRKSKFGFEYTNPTSGNDPDALIRKLVLQMFGCKRSNDLESKDVAKAKEIYSKLSEIFLETYEEHLNDIFDDKS